MISRPDAVNNFCHLDAEESVQASDAGLKIVIKNNRNDRHPQAQRGGHQGFRDARRDDGKATGARDRHALKRFDDADHGAEQADKRCAAGHRAEDPEILPKPLTFLEHGFSGDAVSHFGPSAGVVVKNVEQDSSRRTIAVLFANDDGEIALAFFQRFNQRFADPQSQRADIF